MGLYPKIRLSAAILLFRATCSPLEMTESRLADRRYEFLWTQYFTFIDPVGNSDRFDGAMQKKSCQL